MGTCMACGATSFEKRSRISSILIPVSGNGSSNSLSRSPGVASDVTLRESSWVTFSMMSLVTACPRYRCCSTMSSIMVEKESHAPLDMTSVVQISAQIEVREVSRNYSTTEPRSGSDRVHWCDLQLTTKSVS